MARELCQEFINDGTYTEVNKMNWEQIRVQAAIAAMQGLLSSPVTEGYATFSRLTEENVAALSVKQADALINELKSRNNKL